MEISSVWCCNATRPRPASLYPRGLQTTILFAAALFIFIFAAQHAPAQDYVITNDDSTTNGVSFFTIGAGGSLQFAMEVQGPGLGIGGGLFGMLRVMPVNNGNTQCIFATEAFTNDLFWIVPGSGYPGGSATGSPSDDGSANGIGLAANASYVYASFSSSNTIATFQIQSSCALVFVNDITVAGLNGGIIDGMAIHGNMMIASYADGSIESFNIASGTPVSNGDKQNSTASVGGESYPNGIDITADGHFAIFGDTSTADIVEVSDISSGKLTATVVYQTHAGINSSNVLLSPDESILYISNTQGDVVSAAFFNPRHGPGHQRLHVAQNQGLRLGLVLSRQPRFATDQRQRRGRFCRRIRRSFRHRRVESYGQRLEMQYPRSQGFSNNRRIQPRPALNRQISAPSVLMQRSR